MAKRIANTEGKAAFNAWIDSLNPSSTPTLSPAASDTESTGVNPGKTPTLTGQILATAVRWSLQVLADLAPGRAVEVRVPPYGAVQILEGTTHRRGTPPAVIEMEPQTWLRLAVGSLTWETALEEGSVMASGQRADLSELLPLNLNESAA